MTRTSGEEEYKKEGKNRGVPMWNIPAFVLMPVISYVLFEYVTGNLSSIRWEMAVLNILWIAVFYLVVFAVVGNSRAAVPIVSVLLWGISAAEVFVVSFRGTPIMIWDVMAFGTAMNVAENYVFDFSKEMKIAALAVLAANTGLWFIPLRIKGWKRRLMSGAGTTAAVIGFMALFYGGIVPEKNLEISMWDMDETYRENGYVLCTAVSLKYVFNKPPAGYSQAQLHRIYDDVLNSSNTAQEHKLCPVNIICIMNESLSELKAAGDFTTNIEYFPFLDSLEKNTVKGSLCVPVFGSMTSNTEFEFLTGDSIEVLPTGSNAYQLYVKPGTFSLVSTLKSQGYRSLAMHPYPGNGWNRDHAYYNMGFDEFVYGDEKGEYYEDSERLRNYVSDKGDYEKIIEEIENKDSPDEKLFIFNVTMQNHGGYDMLYDNFRQEVWLTGELEGKYPRADQYLSLMRESDKAFQYLIEYFENCEEPTMIVMFGDHQPGLEDEFFDDIAGMPSADILLAERLMWFETPFVIWTNYEQPSEKMGRLGAVYLSSYMLKLANLELTPYNRFLLNMQQEFPVVNPIGCYTKDGTHYRWREIKNGQCPMGEMVQDYEYLVYNHILDRRVFTEMFELLLHQSY